ncbi:SDR family NAD(P)-dependent oxidoreductase [Streptomyces tendae]
MLKLEGHVAVVTGGAQGIGAETCARLAQDGAIPVPLDLDEAGARRVAQALPNGGRGIGCDITDQDQVSAAVDQIVQQYGRIDVLVNNAGVTRDAMFYKMTRDDWDKVIATHLTGAFTITQEVTKHMVRREYGRLVFVSSRAALGNRGQTNYSAAKAGLQGMAKTLAIELGRYGITSNVVAPGFVETAMTRAITERTGQSWEELTAAMSDRAAVKRIGRPADIAGAIAYFCQPEAGFVTGQTIYATGSPAV